jgi:hypothetical protein
MLIEIIEGSKPNPKIKKTLISQTNIIKLDIIVERLSRKYSIH